MEKIVGGEKAIWWRVSQENASERDRTYFSIKAKLIRGAFWRLDYVGTRRPCFQPTGSSPASPRTPPCLLTPQEGVLLVLLK